MISKIFSKLRSLSLTQQLTTIVVFALSFFLFFVLFPISANIDQIVTTQVYDLIELKQRDVIYYYSHNLDRELLFGDHDPSIVHIIRTSDGEYISNDINAIETELLNQIEIQFDANELLEPIAYRYKDSRLYTIRNIPGSKATIATIVSLHYNEAYKSALLNNIVNLMSITLGTVFLLLLLWVSSIIHPLNVIRNYITKLRNGKNAHLIINREDEIGQLARVIVEMNEEIKHQERVKEEMIQNISHDLKTPIATIKSYSEAIKDGVYPYDTLEKSVDVILEHANRLENKVYSLLTLNRMDYLINDQKLTNKMFDLRETIQNVIVSSKQFNPEIDVRLTGLSSTVYGAEEPWRVVIENLVDNALRYAKTSVIIHTDEHYLSVYNDGSEVDPVQIESLFKAYEKGEGGKFGLGLSIVNKVVSHYGYSVSARNYEDGVIFEVWGRTDDKKR